MINKYYKSVNISPMLFLYCSVSVVFYHCLDDIGISGERHRLSLALHLLHAIPYTYAHQSSQWIAILMA
jgi:hypothetical protein